MKKELCAIATLILLIVGSIGNLIHLNNLIKQISVHADYSLLYCSLEDYSAAHAETSKALQLWQSSENYTRVFIRHSDIDNMYDIFYDVLSAVENRKKYDAEYLLQKLRHRADNIVNMDMISFGSIF